MTRLLAYGKKHLTRSDDGKLTVDVVHTEQAQTDIGLRVIRVPVLLASAIGQSELAPLVVHAR